MNHTQIEGMQEEINRRTPMRCRKCGARMYHNRNVFGMWVGSDCPRCGYVVD